MRGERSFVFNMIAAAVGAGSVAGAVGFVFWLAAVAAEAALRVSWQI
jgi:hypothetical protein